MQTPNQHRQPFQDLREATRLVHECCELGQDSCAWQLHFLEGLQSILEAPVVLFHKATGLSRLGENGRPTIVTAIHLGFTDSQRQVFEEYTRTYDVRDCPLERALNTKLVPDEAFTGRPCDLLDEETWYQSHLFSQCLIPMGLDAFLGARYVRLDGVAYSLVLHRNTGEPPFTTQDRDLLHYCFTQIASLLGDRLVDPTHPSILESLRYRERDVLYLFLEQQSEKDVASQLNISPHTVRDYAKRLNRVFNVHTRDQLIAATLHLQPIVGADYQRRHFREG